MIEIDLLPGGGRPGNAETSRASATRGPLRSHLRDPWIVASGLVVFLSAVVSTVLLVSGRGRTAAVASALDSATRDSLRIATAISESRAMESRLDSLGDRASAIGNLDSRRYLWPRLLDEVARALPDEVWLVQIAQVNAEDGVTRFSVEGRSTGTVALSRFWDGLESSAFIRDVRLLTTEHLVEPLSGSRPSPTRYSFVLEAEYEAGASRKPEPNPLNGRPELP